MTQELDRNHLYSWVSTENFPAQGQRRNFAYAFRLLTMQGKWTFTNPFCPFYPM